MSQPNEAVQDKVHFIFNNISANNHKQINIHIKFYCLQYKQINTITLMLCVLQLIG